MAFPLIPGSNPFTGTVTADQWTLVAESVKTATINNDYNASQIVYFTYLNENETAPVGLDIPKWKLSDDYDPFDGAGTFRDLYVYPVDTDATITVET